MIQEIFPHQYHVEYLPEAVPTPDSGLMVCAGRGVLLKSDVNPETGKAEERMKQIETVLAAPGPSDDIMELTRTYLECKRDMDAQTAEWEILMESIDN